MKEINVEGDDYQFSEEMSSWERDRYLAEKINILSEELIEYRKIAILRASNNEQARFNREMNDTQARLNHKRYTV